MDGRGIDFQYIIRKDKNLMKIPRLTDTTLRDGSHAISHKFSIKTIKEVVTALDQAGVPVIEVSHGAGLGGATLQEGFSAIPEFELIQTAVDHAKNAKIASLLVPGIGTTKDLRKAADIGIEIVRVAVHCTEVDVSQQYIEQAKELGLEAVGFLMMSHMATPQKLAEQASLLESYGCDCVYIVDSAGTMLPDDIKARVKALKTALNIQIGIHTHNNLGVAVGNVLAAMEIGVDQVDGSLRGLGAGAGNAMTEVLVPILNKTIGNVDIDMFKLMDTAEKVIAPLHQVLPDKDNIAIGYAGVYSSFLTHAKHVAKRFNIDPMYLLLEIGKMEPVAGQEDWLYEIAVQLQEKQV